MGIHIIGRENRENGLYIWCGEHAENDRFRYIKKLFRDGGIVLSKPRKHLMTIR